MQRLQSLHSIIHAQDQLIARRKRKEKMTPQEKLIEQLELENDALREIFLALLKEASGKKPTKGSIEKYKGDYEKLDQDKKRRKISSSSSSSS